MSTIRPPWEITREMFLSEAEAAGLLASVRDRAPAAGRAARTELAERVTDRVIIEGLMFSGLRCSEFCGLLLRDTVVGTGQSAFVVGRPGERRTVWVPDALSRLVRDYARARSAAGEPDRHLILTERGRPYDRTGLYRRVVRILTQAGLGERASVQLLRHTYGYLAYLRTGGNLLFVQRQLGHSHPMVTSVYAQFVEHSYEKMANAIAGGSSRTRRSTSDKRQHRKDTR